LDIAGKKFILFAAPEDLTDESNKKVLSSYINAAKEVAGKRNLKTEDIDWFLPHLSSMYFRSKIFQELESIGFLIPEEKWFLNLPHVGNVAAASAFLMLDELFLSGKLKKGEKILIMVPESARFSYAFVYLTVC